MQASNVTSDILENAASRIGVKVEITTLNQKGTRHRVKLLPDAPPEAYTLGGNRRKGSAGDAPYQRESAGYGSAGRRVNAVCWHGFRDYFRKVFETDPNAVFRTALATWKGSEDFEARFAASGHKNIGPPIAPVMVSDACRCPDRGYAF